MTAPARIEPPVPAAAASALRRHLRQWRWLGHRLLGWPGALGSLALIAALLIRTQVHDPLVDQRRAQLRDKVAQLSARAAAPVNRAAGSGPAPVARDPRDEWLDAMPDQRQRTALVSRLVGVAEGAGLAIGTAEYSVEASTPGISRLRVSMPVAGSYAQVRRHVGRALGLSPYIGLDSLQIERPAGEGRSGLQATLRWSLYFREAAP